MVAEVEPVKGAVEIPEIVVEPAHGWFALELGDLWRYRELLYFLTWRDREYPDL